MPEVNEKPSPLMEKLKEFENEMRIKGLKDSTIKQQMYYLKEFCSYVDKPADLLERKDVVDYLVKARERLQESTYAILFVVVNSFLKFCKKDFELQAPKKPKKDRIFLSEEEVQKIIDTCETPEARLVIKFLYTSGMRVSEACKARIEDMQPERGLIKIIQGKGGKDRWTLLSLTWLEEFKAFDDRKEGFIFSKENNKSFAPITIQRIVGRAAKKAGILKKVTPHTLRHSFSTSLLRKGVNIKLIQSTLGHESLATTSVYTHVLSSDLEKLPDLGKEEKKETQTSQTSSQGQETPKTE